MKLQKISLLFALFCMYLMLTTGTASAFSQGQNTVSGKIVETMDSGGYSYVLLEQENEKIWAAIPLMKLTVGETISLNAGMVMPSFTSKTLNRTFTNIIFSPGPAR